MNQGWTYREQVDRASAGVAVLEYYTRRYRHSSREDWQQRIVSGQVCLDGLPVSPETSLQAGQWLSYQRPPWKEPDVPLEFGVLHDDADLLIVTKPAGLPVLPGGGFLEHTLLWQLQQRYPQILPVPIHRLGRGTSGLMLIAKSPLAKSVLSQQMRDRQIRKTYRALVGSGVMPDHFTITQPIGKIPHPVLGYVYGAAADGRAALSECEVLSRTTATTLLQVTILTGRPHQIRIHLATVGFPLMGDPLYVAGGLPRLPVGDTPEEFSVPGDCGYHLHAYQLVFNHPRTHQPLSVMCPAPPKLAV